MGCSACKKRLEISKLQIAMNASKAAGRAIKAMVRGQPVYSTTQMFMKRVEICKNCPSKKYRVEDDRCMACGCFIKKSIVGAPGKATLITERCQLGHWD